MSKNKIFKAITIVLGLITIINFGWHVYNYRDDIFKKFDGVYWTNRYQQSQWVVPNSKNSIGDDGLYIYEGYRYINGDDPTLLNPEVPPLGKYIIGFFETTTGYTGIFSLFCAILALALFFVLNKLILKSFFLALTPVAILSFDPLFIAQIRAPYLDTLYLSFLLLGFIFSLKKRYLWASVSFGAFMSVKSSFLIILVFLAILIYLFLQRKPSFKWVVAMFLVTILVFVLSYTSTFLHGHDLVYFLKVQKYILHFYQTGAKAVIGSILSILFTGNWYTWFGPVERIPEWTILWPIATILQLLGIYYAYKQQNKVLIFEGIWIVLYMLFLIITPVFARYLLLLLPFEYNLSIWGLSAVLKQKLALA